MMCYLLEHNRIYSIFGILVILGIAYACSTNRRQIALKQIFSSLVLLGISAFFMLKTVIGQRLILVLSRGIGYLYQAADKGIEFVFGALSVVQEPWGFVFAFKILPALVFFSAFMAFISYSGITQVFVRVISSMVGPVLGISGPETVCTVANSFLGQTEAPLLIRSYLPSLTKSEFALVMISGMASMSSALIAVLARMGVPLEHLLAASIMSIPASILLSKLLYPETEVSQTAGAHNIIDQVREESLFSALATGTSEGLSLALNVGAMLIAVIALLGLLNEFLSTLSGVIYYYAGLSFAPVTLDKIFALLGVPFGWLLGLTGDEAFYAGDLLGTKVAINELVAYSKLITLPLSYRTKALLTYALAGFSNFSCIGIQLGGIGALVPQRRAWLSQIGLRAVLGGALANILSALVANILL
jgi:CNT family concentrative nucleoside transporter